VSHVILEHRGDLCDERLIRDYRGRLKIKTERSIIEIRRPYRRVKVIDYHYLLMEKPLGVTVHLDAMSGRRRNIKERRQPHQEVVFLSRKDYAHINTAQRRQLKGAKKSVVRYEIGAGDPHPGACGCNAMRKV
jgi:hypothetical protein